MKFRALLMLFVILFQPLLATGAVLVESIDSPTAATDHCGSGNDATDSEDHVSCADDCGMCVSCAAATAGYIFSAAAADNTGNATRLTRAPPTGIHTLLYRPPILS